MSLLHAVARRGLLQRLQQLHTRVAARAAGAAPVHLHHSAAAARLLAGRAAGRALRLGRARRCCAVGFPARGWQPRDWCGCIRGGFPHAAGGRGCPAGARGARSSAH